MKNGKKGNSTLGMIEIIIVEMGTFTPLVFSTTGGMGRECKIFYTRLCQVPARKRKFYTQQTTDYIRTKFSFSLLRSTLLCLRVPVL